VEKIHDQAIWLCTFDPAGHNPILMHLLHIRKCSRTAAASETDCVGFVVELSASLPLQLLLQLEQAPSSSSWTNCISHFLLLGNETKYKDMDTAVVQINKVCLWIIRTWSFSECCFKCKRNNGDHYTICHRKQHLKTCHFLTWCQKIRVNRKCQVKSWRVSVPLILQWVTFHPSQNLGDNRDCQCLSRDSLSLRFVASPSSFHPREFAFLHPSSFLLYKNQNVH